MTCLFDLPPEIIEKIVLNIPSKNIPRDILAKVLSYLGNETYCRYILGGMLPKNEINEILRKKSPKFINSVNICRLFIKLHMSPYPYNLDHIYINVFCREITLTEQKNYRIIDKNFAKRLLFTNNFEFLSINTSLIRVWTGIPDLIIPLNLFITTAVSYRDYKNQVLSKISNEEQIQLKVFVSNWSPNPYGNRYPNFKHHDIQYIKQLTITIDDNSDTDAHFIPLRPKILTINIDSNKSTFSVTPISQIVDVRNVVKFSLAYHKRSHTISELNYLYKHLKRVRELDITLGCISRPSVFFRAKNSSITKFTLTLYGSKCLDEEWNADSYKEETLRYLKPALTDDGVYSVYFVRDRRL